MRIGILGYGYMGTIRHRVLTDRDDCTVVRIFHTEAVEGLAAGVFASTWREVVEDPRIEAIFVCLPNDLTCDVVCAALEAGLHVFAEKPPGRTVVELEQMAAAELPESMRSACRVQDHPASAIDDLLPHRWKELFGEGAAEAA
jgi:predicted dehydrogenase